MATPNFIPGRRMKISRSLGNSPETFQFLGIISTRTIKMSKAYAETTAPDDNNPTDVPNRKSVVTEKSWDATFAGKLDAAKLALFQADVDSEDPVRYKFELIPEVTGGGGYWIGAVHYENFEINGDFQGMVSFTISARGDDALTWTAAP